MRELGFLGGTSGVSIFMGYGAASLGNLWATWRHKMAVPYSTF